MKIKAQNNISPALTKANVWIILLKCSVTFHSDKASVLSTDLVSYREVRGEGRATALGPLGPHSVRANFPRQSSLFFTTAPGRRCLTGHRVLDAPGNTGTFFLRKRKAPFPLINPLPRRTASVCKTCLLNWSEKGLSRPDLLFPSSAQAAKLPLLSPSNNKQYHPQRAGGRGCLSHCPPLLCSRNQGLCLIFPLQKPSCACLARQERASLSAPSVSSPRLSAQCILARQPEIRAAAQEWAQGFLLPEGPTAQGQRCLLPCQNAVTLGWTLISCLSRAREKEKGSVSTCSGPPTDEDHTQEFAQDCLSSVCQVLCHSREWLFV